MFTLSALPAAKLGFKDEKDASCQAKCRNGTECFNRATKGDYCWKHIGEEWDRT